MKVLVTGGCGFLGSHVCEYFLERGWQAVSYDNMTKSELLRTGYKPKPHATTTGTSSRSSASRWCAPTYGISKS